MNGSNRRVFMLQVAAASGTALMAAKAQAQAALVNEKDAQAAALGYVADSTKVDAKKFPKHAAAQMCSNCQVYAGKPADPAGPCAIFPGKLVAGKGWCSAYVKKAG
ncbi:high-potential iron-sulfur protein [Hydrogenophaga sp.]|uniref:high-potential iron-sulfur protein n=1 Tax=Hydrogenophaga sp. TaxID=1904254 RepID=UPI003AF6BD4D